MARKLARKDTAVQCLGYSRYPRARGIIIKVMEPGTVYFSTTNNDLNAADSAGNPKGGFALQNTDPALVIPAFRDDLFFRCAAAGANTIDVEITEFKI